jgi:hypothetical protein
MVPHRKEMSDRLRHWYEQTQNPLYVWEAIAEALNAGTLVIPDWCIPYLREVAVNLTRLASVRENEDNPGGGILPRIPPLKAMRQVPEALSLSRQGKRNAFADLIVDRRDADDAWHSLTDYPVIAPLIRELALKHIEGNRRQTGKKRRVSRDRAKNIIKRGKRLLRVR